MKNSYEDMIHLPHHVSQEHAQMTMQERAAQFSPFAALTGYGDTFKETARLTDEWIEPDEQEKEELNRRLRQAVEEKLKVNITYYIPDAKKQGGTYAMTTGVIRKVDEYAGTIKMLAGEIIPIENIHGVENHGFDDII